jgi:hypothetical protein
MYYLLLADFVVLLHLAFIIFAVLGGVSSLSGGAKSCGCMFRPFCGRVGLSFPAGFVRRS